MLSFMERRLLQSYYFLTGRYYRCKDENSVALMQNVAYFLLHKGCLSSSGFAFAFSLTPEGMYSPGLSATLKSFDKREGEIEAFEYSKDLVKDFPLRDWKRVNSLVDFYDLDTVLDSKKDAWLIALACVLYVKTSFLPGCNVDLVVDRVMEDVSCFDRNTARKAFSYLDKGGRGSYDDY